MQAATKLGSRLQVWYLLLQLFRYLKTSVTTEVTTLWRHEKFWSTIWASTFTLVG
jgi:hypothetical protein